MRETNRPAHRLGNSTVSFEQKAAKATKKPILFAAFVSLWKSVQNSQ
jgi:hypothetical protein